MALKKYKTIKERKEAKRLSNLKWEKKNKAKIAAKKKEWAKKNPEKIKAAVEKYKRTKKGKEKIRSLSIKNYLKNKNTRKYKVRIKSYQAEYRKTEKHKKYQKKYKKKHKKKYQDYMKEYANNPKYIEYKKKYAKSEKGINARKRYKKSDSFKKNFKKRMKTDPNFKIATYLRNQVRIRIRNTLGATKSKKTFDLLGCDINFFKNYVEKKFKKGMTWKNWDRYGWHLDHIKPVAKFDLTRKSEQKKCFHYSNLQPLWAKENLVKRDKY